MKILYEARGVPPLKVIEKGDWIDLCLAEDVTLEPGQFKPCSLGIRMLLPKGFEAIVALRSSTGKRFKVLQYNAPGIVDESYAPEGASIKAGERVAQFRIQPKMMAGVLVKLRWLFTSRVRFFKVNKIARDTNRGGLGSTNSRQ